MNIFIITGSFGFLLGLLMFYFGAILIEDNREYISSLPPPEYNKDVSSVPPMQYFHYMTILGIPISLASAPVIVYGFIKWKYGYVYVPFISGLLVAIWFTFLFSRGS